MAILKDMTWSRIQPPVRVFCANTVSKCLPHIFTSTGQSGSQHPPVEAATDDHDRFGSSFEEPDLVQLLLDAEMNVHPDEATVPLLTIAMLHQNEGIVQALLTALADP